MLKNLIKLIVSLSLISNVYADTTENLVSQDFTTGWTGTNLTSKHGSGTIAGVNGNYILSDSVSLNDSGINKESLNEGFTVTGSAEYWFWSGYNASVTQTIKTVDDNGNILTQTRVVTGTSGSYNTLSDQLIVNSNTQQDYNVSLKYDFADTSGYNSHYSADLKNPSLTVSYTYVAPLDTATQTELFDMNKTITETLDAKILTEEFKQDIGVNYTNSLTGEVYGTEPPTSDITSIDSKEEKQESTPTEQLQSDQDSTSSSDTSSQEEKQTQETSAQTTENQQTNTLETSEKTESKKESQSISLNDNLQKVEAKVNNLDVALKQNNLDKLNVMLMDSVVLIDNKEFYKDKKIYENQINLIDNRVIYTSNLNTYIQNDPIAKKEIYLYRLNIEKQKLLNEIEVLKNG